MRQALPAYGSEIILMVKATSLASIITMMEVTGIAAKLISQTFRAVEVFIVAGLIYLVLNFLITRIIMAIEWWLSPAPAPAARLSSRAWRPPMSNGARIRVARNHASPPLRSRTICARASARSRFSRASRWRRKEGDVISILGASGSGKSTMLRCINMLEVPDSGEIRIGGEDIALKTAGTGMEPADQTPGGPHPLPRRAWCSRASISGPT